MTGKAASVIAGIGATAFSRRSGRSVRGLAAEAAQSAMTDAGISARDVDGVVPVGGSIFTDDLVTALGLRESVTDALPAPGGNSGVSSVGLADMMIRSGLAGTVLVVFARNGSSASRIAGRVSTLPGQHFRTYLERPQGWVTPAQWYSMIARRHMVEYGTTKDAMAEVALAMRAHAQLNPSAMLHGKPLTREDYDAAPMITDPYQRWDCCLETDGAVALVIRTLAEARDSERDAVILAVKSSRPESPDDLTNRQDWLHIGLSRAAAAAYEQAGMGPEDVDAAMIYDCFTFEVLHQLEEAGFCPRGGSDSFVRAGSIRLGGALPVNTHGGLLAEGHLGGMAHVAEAVRQVRGEAGGRQVTAARTVAVTGWGDWGDGSLALIASRSSW